MPPQSLPGARVERWYVAVWRWHFYAGLFCIPFVLWLSVTGAIYLFKPQIETWLDAPYRGLAAPGVAMLAPSRVAAAATAEVPGAVLYRYFLPAAPADAVQLLVGRGTLETRVWVHPQTGAVLKAQAEESRPMRVVFRLHGELLAGARGSALVEIAACWTIVMIVTGLYLWWPRGSGLRGVLWPSRGRGRRRFWRDLHAVTGFWVSLAAIFLIVTGLPWAKNWGGYLREVRTATGTAAARQDWSAGSAADAAARAALDRGVRQAMAGHEGHEGAAPSTGMVAGIDRVVASATRLALPTPVDLTPPARAGEPWLARSQPSDRALRRSAQITADGRVVGTRGYGDDHWIDRLVGFGIAVHEGAWLGLANQLANLVVLAGLVTLALSAVVLWWRRRPEGVLGAPPPQGAMRHSWLLVALVLLLALMMPLFGATLALVALAERVVRAVAPTLGRWLGLRAMST